MQRSPQPSGNTRTRAFWQSNAFRGVVLAAAVAVAGAFVVDAVLREHRTSLERERVARVASPTAEALRAAVERRVALLEGLRSFANSRSSRGALDEEFQLYAQGLIASVTGVRALQLVQDGRIVATWPIVGNEAALGYDLLSDPRRVIARDIQRAMETGEAVITGPIRLVQGGEGLLVRERLTPRAGFPQLVAIILDVPAVVRDAGLPDPRTGLKLEVRDRAGRWFGGDPAGSAVRPETLTVRVPDGDWTVLAAPVDGWGAAIAPQMAATRGATVSVIAALMLLGFLFGERMDRAAAAAKDSRAQLGVALRAARMGTWEWDITHDQLRWCEVTAQMMGRPPKDEDGLGRDFISHVHADDRDFVLRCLQEVLASERSEYLLEYRVHGAGETERWVFAMGEIERAADGRAVRARGVISDSTGRRALEERVRHTERLETIGTLAGGVAHDFNNLLTAMTSFAELALEELTTADEDPAVVAAREDLVELLAAAARASALTGQILAFSRRAHTVAPSALDAAQVVRELTPMLRRILGTGITLEVEIAEGPQVVWMHAGQLTQILLNLITNARDATPESGRVTIRIAPVGAAVAAEEGVPASWIRLEVEDTGRGMDAETQERIFEPYFTTKRSPQGTGLGLAVLMGALKSAGGEIRVQSALGRGSRFRIMLPPSEPPRIGAMASSVS